MKLLEIQDILDQILKDIVDGSSDEDYHKQAEEIRKKRDEYIISNKDEEIKNPWGWDANNVPKTGWYHGTNNEYDQYDIEATKANRGTNLSGLYLTPLKSEAEDYGEYVHEYEVKVNKAYQHGISPVTDAMAEKYREVANKYYSNKSWVDEAIVPEFIKTKRMKSDISGEDKTAVAKAGGYDAYKDGGHLVVFDPAKNAKRVK